MKGFKSFPNRTKLEFGPGVSVVVGPNGSGKSNITDAVLWSLGEQSPLAVRGQSMKDVIFAGAHGVQGANAAEVEVVIDNHDGALEVDFSEISIVRRLDRHGEGEYRLNGARCRLVDVVEVLSDSGLGKEMHSVVSQGKVEQIVLSRPRDRRLMIEEAAGLGKHRKRRRRAQLKLERTEENLSRALDVEREARSRLRPLKRQAEAAELHERLERQTLEARYALARDATRSARLALGEAEERARVVRAERDEAERLLGEVAKRREEAEEAFATQTRDRERLQARLYAARSAERADRDEAGARARAGRRRGRAARAPAAPGGGARAAGRGRRAAGRRGGAPAGPDRLDRGGARGPRRGARGAPGPRAGRPGGGAGGGPGTGRGARGRGRASARAHWRRRSRRRTTHAPRDARPSGPQRPRGPARPGWAPSSPRSTSSCAVRAAGRARRCARRRGGRRPEDGSGGHRRTLAERLHVEAGYELALAAVLGPRLTAAVVNDRDEGERLLDAAGPNGGAVLLSGTDTRPYPGQRLDAEPFRPLLRCQPGNNLRNLCAPSGRSRRSRTGCSRGVWVVDSLSALPDTFSGIAVTRSGRLFDARTGELSQAPAGGAERLLEELAKRDELVAPFRAGRSRRGGGARRRQSARRGAVADADTAREDAESALRAALRAAADAADALSRSEWLMARRREAPEDGPEAVRRAELLGDLRAEQRLAERIEREREERARALAALRTGAERDLALSADAERAATALEAARDAVTARREALDGGARGRRRRRRGDRRRAQGLRARGGGAPGTAEARQRGGDRRRGRRTAGARLARPTPSAT